MLDHKATPEVRLQAALLIRDTAYGKPVAELPRRGLQRQARKLFGERLEYVVQAVAKLLQKEFAITVEVSERMARTVLGLTEEIVCGEIPGPPVPDPPVTD